MHGTRSTRQSYSREGGGGAGGTIVTSDNVESDNIFFFHRSTMSLVDNSSHGTGAPERVFTGNAPF